MSNDRQYHVIERDLLYRPQETKSAEREQQTEDFWIGYTIYQIVVPPNVVKLVLKLPIK
ncbi:hypothetical protein [Herbaspirillum huttiense]|uniref:Uncharacterized protein n=2 Tax=Herbaspirillum huttiense TaxID=863372 RepID=A0AAJ2H9G6_9BURK|nr:hypothetical protein [Herbaspirillum huttiense]MDR9839407.1 hypothetical protein [Herbaspirillum huttiense]